MKVDVLLGLQWGDEGKGKIVDVFTPKYDIIARFQGGPNAGHTLEFEGIKHVLHTIPSGIFRENVINLVGNGVVIDPIIFKVELEKLACLLKVQKLQTSLKSSGFRKLKIRQFEVLINLGNINPKYQPGHTHSDMMSIYLWKGNKQLIVDTGVSTYECNKDRLFERSTLAHNTITLNGNSQSDVWGSFRIGKKSKLILNIDKYNMLSAEVNNMFGLSPNTKHQRNFEIINDKLHISDFVCGEKIDIVNRIHLDYSVKPIIDGNTIYFDDFLIKYCSGLKSLELDTYEQAIGFNVKKNAYKVVACVDNVSSFIISENI